MKGGLCRLRGASERRRPPKRGSERGRSQSGTGRTTAPLQPLAAWRRPHPLRQVHSPLVLFPPLPPSRRCLPFGCSVISNKAVQSPPPLLISPPKVSPKVPSCRAVRPPRSDILLSNSLVTTNNCTSSPLCQFRERRGIKSPSPSPVAAE